MAGGVIAAAGIGSFLKGSIDEAREAQKVGAATSAIIKSTGSAAGITAGQVGKMATRLSNVTGIDDEAIQSGSNLLLTFKNVKNYVDGQFVGTFDRATASAVDLSAAGFGSIESASKTLGKALNDPVKGVSALSRAGVTFTDEQKKQIKSFVDSGQAAKAQNLILNEVESQVGGVAAATSTYGDKAKVAFGNIKEQIGGKLLPVIDSLAQTFLKAVPTITKTIDGIGPAFTRAKDFLAPFIAQVRSFFSTGGGSGFLPGLKSVAASLSKTLLPAIASLAPVAKQLFGFLIAQIPRLTGFIKSLAPIFDQVLALLPSVFALVKSSVAAAIPVFKTIADTLFNLVLPAVRNLVSYVVTSLAPVFVQVVGIITNRVIPILASLSQFFFGTLYPAIIGIYTAVAKNLKPVFDQLVATFKAKVLPALDQLLAAIQRNLPTFQKIATVVVKVAGFLLKLAAAILAKVLPPLIRLAGFIIGRAVGAFSDLLDGITKVVNFLPKIAAFATGVKEKIGKAVDYIKRLPDRMVAALGNLKTLLLSAGRDLIAGLISGITSKMGDLKKTLNSVTKFIPKHKGPESTDRVLLTPAGATIMQSLINGLEGGKKKLRETLASITDDIRTKVEGLKDDFASLSSSVAGNLTGSLFSGFDTAASFLTNLTTVKGNLGSALSDLKVLQGFGLSPKFLSQLFADGGFPLIHQLAADKGSATAAGALFGDIQSLSSGIGDSVAQLDIGPKLDEQTALLAELVALGKQSPAEVGKIINGAATGGKGKGNKGGKRGR